MSDMKERVHFRNDFLHLLGDGCVYPLARNWLGVKIMALP